jgi:hypothetical protein
MVHSTGNSFLLWVFLRKSPVSRQRGEMKPNLDRPPPQAHLSCMVAAVEAQSNKQLHRNPNSRLTPADQAQIRTRYLVRGEAPKEIADALSLPVGPIQDLVHRRGWTKIRAGRWAAKSAETEAIMTADVDRVMTEAAFTTEELLTGSGELARKSLSQQDCKGLSMVSTAMRNFAEIAYKLRGRDQNEGQRASNVNFFVLGAAPQRAEASQSEMKRAEPVAPAAIETSVSAIETVALSQQALPATQ